MFKSTPIAAAALLGLVLTAAPAFAKDVQVRYADLDLASAQGQKTLERRIDRAAREACDYGPYTTGTRIPSQAAAACYRQALASAKTMMAAKVEAAQESRLGG
ncbi:MAG TPA: UrcA family protein [Novosphingobium sp.]|nr:UrcA family protein [Novosphingobium sp.]